MGCDNAKNQTGHMVQNTVFQWDSLNLRGGKAALNFLISIMYAISYDFQSMRWTCVNIDKGFVNVQMFPISRIIESLLFVRVSSRGFFTFLYISVEFLDFDQCLPVLLRFFIILTDF